MCLSFDLFGDWMLYHAQYIIMAVTLQSNDFANVKNWKMFEDP